MPSAHVPGPQVSSRRALVTGASGYVGGQLVPRLLAAGWAVRVLTRRRSAIQSQSWAGSVEIIEGDAADPATLDAALSGPSPESLRIPDQTRRAGVLQDAAMPPQAHETQGVSGVDVAYYLMHSMGGSEDFATRDRDLALTFAAAAERAKVGRIVYLSGLHPDGAELSPHLASRVEVGDILLKSDVPTAVLQAAVILGSGSVSFDMLRYLSGRLPAMVAPKWLNSRIQPVAIDDVLHYLVGVADLPPDVDRTFDIGGPEVLTYREMLQRFASVTGLGRRLIVTVPVLTPRLASHWVGLVTPVDSKVAKPLVGSLIHDVVCREHDLASFVAEPPGGLTGFDEAVRRAVAEAPPDHGLRDFVGVLAGTAASAALGSLVTDPDGRWYAGLDLPAWQPPTLAFPIVWTALYADIAVTSAAALSTLEHHGRDAEAAAYRRALAGNLVLNTAWSAIFWRMRRPGLAAVEASLLTASGVDLVRRVRRARSRSGYALAPYPLWCGFATTLSAAIARRNPRP